jgi:hypothetical protein
MTVRQDLITLLKAQLSQAALQLGTADANFTVIEFVDPVFFQEKYLFNRQKDVLFTVKTAQSLGGRSIQTVNHKVESDFEIGVWCASREPDLYTAFIDLRDAAVEEVKRVITAYPTYGKYKTDRCDDHRHKNYQIFNSVCVVTYKAQF